MQPFLINTDGDPKNQPDKSSRMNINVNLDYEYGTISTEDGNDPIVEYPTVETPTAVTIGKIPLRDGDVLLLSAVPGNSKFPTASRFCSGEIGILSENNSYRVLLRDNGPDVATGDLTSFGWNLNTQIQGIYKINSDNTTTVYFVDSLNVQRYLNIDDPNILTNDYYQVTSAEEFSKLDLLAPFTNSTIELLSVDSNGNLPTGAYYTVLVYADEDFNEANPLFPSNPVSIVNEISLLPLNEYDGAPANSASSKSYTIQVTAPDTRFTYFRVYVVAKIDSVLTVYDFDYQSIPTSGDFTYEVTSLDNKATSSLDVLINKVNWIPKTITQLDDRAYIANLKEPVLPNLQPWFNGIIVDIASDQSTAINIDSSTTSFHNEKAIYTSKVFQYDDVYALYGSAIYKDGTESELYHIPGRNAFNVTPTASTVPHTIAVYEANPISTSYAASLDPWTYDGGSSIDTSPGGEIYRIDHNAKIFHAFDTAFNPNAVNIKDIAGIDSKLGYWENENEYYPTTNDWTIKDSAGNVVGEDLRGQNVRHHKMPSAIHFQNTGYDTYYPLALKFQNIQLPAELSTEIIGINFYYAKRTNINRLVLGQSMIHPDLTLTKSTGATWTDGSGQDTADYVFSLGSTIKLKDYMSGSNPTSQIRNLTPNLTRFKASPFDAIDLNTNLSAASYMKVIKKTLGQFIDYSTPLAPSISDGGGLLNYTAKLNYETSLLENVDLTTSDATEHIRKFKGIVQTAESIPSYPLGTDIANAHNAGQLNYTLNTVHYRADKHVILELDNALTEAISYNNNIVEYTNNVGTSAANRVILIANICTHRTDLYLAFDQQEAIYTGVMYPVDASAFGAGMSIDNVYGGDTFVNWYGHRGVADIVGALNFDHSVPWTTENIAGEWRTLHKYVCESNANIAYRHQGTGQYDIYYPKSTIVNVLGVPLLPFGFGNYYGYNTDYSAVNNLRAPKIHVKNYIPTLTSFPTRIARSAVDNPESAQDNYRTYLANEYYDVEKSKGEITNIVNYSNRLIIQHENSIKSTATRDRMKTDSQEAYLGAGDLFDYPPKDLILTDSGYSGLKHQFASVLTQYGIYFPDVNTSKIFCLNSELKIVSDDGVSLFCLDHLKLTFETYYKNLIFSLTSSWAIGTYNLDQVVKHNNYIWKVIVASTTTAPNLTNTDWEVLYNYESFNFKGKDSLYYGYIAGFDNYYRRYILTKKDIIVTQDFTDNFIGQYDATLISGYIADITLFVYEGQLYILRATANYDTIPLGGYYAEPIYFNNKTYFIQNRFSLAHYPEYKGWASWYQYYPDNYVTNRNTFLTTKDNVLFQQNVDTNILIPDNDGPVDTTIEPIFNQQEPVRLLSVQWKTKAIDNNGNEEVLTTFTSAQAYDSYQLSKGSTINNTVNSRNIEGYWSNNDFRDDTTNNSLKVVDNSLWYRPFTNNINYTKHWSKLKKLVDYWFGVRFIYTPYTETNITLHPGNFAIVSNYDTYVTANLYVTSPIAVGDVLKLTTSLWTIYAKVVVDLGVDAYKIKLYGPVTFTSSVETITSVTKLTKKAKLHLLDVAKLVIKNIR